VVFGAIAAIFVSIALWGGWSIYNYYRPNVTMTKNFSWGMAAVSVVAATAAFFSPCAFGMLPAYFGFYTGASPTSPDEARTRTALWLGVAACPWDDADRDRPGRHRFAAGGDIRA